MGYGLGASLGAKLGMPHKTVINIAGDGCFRMNMNEIATAARYNIPIIQVVVNNHVLGRLAEALGAVGIRATTKEEFQEAFERALGLGKPAVIDCQIHSDDKVWPMVAPGAPIQEAFDEKDLKDKK